MTQNRSTAVMQRRHEPPDSLDFFPTPPFATRALCEFIAAHQDLSQLSAWDPCCGEGDMVRPLSEYFADVHATDVHDYSAKFPDQFGCMDFASDWMVDDHIAADWIITNPPFRLAEDIITTALRCAGAGVAMLVRTAFLEGHKRHRTLFSGHPPSHVLQFCERVPIYRGRLIERCAKYWDAEANDGAGAIKSGTSASSYCWLIWSDIQTPPATQLRWIAPCKARLDRPGDYPSPPQRPAPDNPMGV